MGIYARKDTKRTRLQSCRKNPRILDRGFGKEKESGKDINSEKTLKRAATLPNIKCQCGLLSVVGRCRRRSTSGAGFLRRDQRCVTLSQDPGNPCLQVLHELDSHCNPNFKGGCSGESYDRSHWNRYQSWLTHIQATSLSVNVLLQFVF